MSLSLGFNDGLITRLDRSEGLYSSVDYSELLVSWDVSDWLIKIATQIGIQLIF